MKKRNLATPRRLSLSPLGLPLLSLPLLLASCAPSSTAGPPSTPMTLTMTSTADSGPGTLRDLLGSARAGDTLRLASGTIVLAGPLEVTKNVTLDLGSSVIDAAGKGRVMEVPVGVTVSIKGGTLQGGVGQVIPISSGGQQALSLETYGGVILNRGTLTLDGTAITGGQANMGGGIANFKTGTLTLKGTANITGNTAQALPAGATEDSGGGGGIYNSGTLKMEGGAVNGNSAAYTGGGILALTPGSVTISGGSVDNNACTTPLTVDGKDTRGCSGGGIYTYSGLTLSGGTVRGNTCTVFGGGVYVDDSLDSTGKITGNTFTMSGGEISGNTASIAGGGISLSQRVTMNLRGGSVLNNKATDTVGGGIDNRGKLIVTAGSVTGNTTKTQGGGVFTAKTATYAQSGGSVTGNTPDNVFTQP